MSSKLKKARNIISDITKWTQDHYAKNNLGQIEEILSVQAVCFCATGALYRTYGLEPQDHILTSLEQIVSDANTNLSYDYICLDLAAKQLGYSGCITLNDTSDHNTVLKMYDLAILIQEKRD